MKMEKHIYYAWALENSICVICCTTLAVLFNKWWIVLFAILFRSSLKNEKTNPEYHFVCDKCGRVSPSSDTPQKALGEAKKFGWTRKKVDDEWKDYCPSCQ